MRKPLAELRGKTLPVILFEEERISNLNISSRRHVLYRKTFLDIDSNVYEDIHFPILYYTKSDLFKPHKSDSSLSNSVKR